MDNVARFDDAAMSRRGLNRRTILKIGNGNGGCLRFAGNANGIR